VNDIDVKESIHTDRQHGCARCGADGHDDLTYLPLTYPIEFGDAANSVATHWAPCPTNGEPILLCTMDIPGDKK
jgi:hypothetical protein